MKRHQVVDVKATKLGKWNSKAFDRGCEILGKAVCVDVRLSVHLIGCLASRRARRTIRLVTRPGAEKILGARAPRRWASLKPFEALPGKWGESYTMRCPRYHPSNRAGSLAFSFCSD